MEVKKVFRVVEKYLYRKVEKEDYARILGALE